MSKESIYQKSNSLSDKIIDKEGTPFKLWLEFEETSSWNDITNDFANIAVDMMDGRCYSINIWTFKFFQTALAGEQKEEPITYLIPPDLFVKTLSRECIEDTIKALLSVGDLDIMLNPSIFSLKFKEPWIDLFNMDEKAIHAIDEELKKEIHPQHPLYNTDYTLWAKREDNDDVLIKIDNERLAVIHLTWKGTVEIDEFPRTHFFANDKDFWLREFKDSLH